MKNIPHVLKVQFWVSIVAIIAIVLAYKFIDQSVVFWVQWHHPRDWELLKLFSHLSDLFIVIAFVAYPILFVRFCYGKQGYYDRMILLLANSVAITSFLKANLKIVFGRYWPATWVGENLSLLHDHVYGFQWFHAGVAYESFPSGHTAIAAAAVFAIAEKDPRLRAWAIILVLLVALCQVGLYYHFVSDVIAGALLGYLVAVSVAKMSKVAELRL